MTTDRPQFLTVGSGETSRQIAYRIDTAGASAEPGKPGLMWLPGLKSDMVSTKATALAAWSADNGHTLTRYDYSGHGQSSGAFEAATIGDWLEETAAVFQTLTSGPQILVGSSTGGYLALLLVRYFLGAAPEQAARIHGLVLIAPAWDLTEALMWANYPEDARREILENGVYHQPSEYGEPFVITRNFIEEGRNHLFGTAPFDPGCPIVILQGAQDTAVPLVHVKKLVAQIVGDQADLIVVPDGEHRMSRPQDIARLFASIAKLAAVNA